MYFKVNIAITHVFFHRICVTRDPPPVVGFRLGFGCVSAVTTQKPSAGIQHWSPYNGQVMPGIGVSETRVSKSRSFSVGWFPET